MKIKHLSLYLVTIILILSLVFASGCQLIYIIDRISPDYDERGDIEDPDPTGEFSPEEEKKLDEAIIAAEEELEAEKKKAEEAELEEGFEEEEKLFPDEPVTYVGNIEGVGINLVVDFESKDVSGLISSDDGVWYIDAPIVSGSIEDMETLSITTFFEGIIGNREAGRSEPFAGSIYGSITEDLSTFEGTFLETTEGYSEDFTANRE